MEVPQKIKNTIQEFHFWIFIQRQWKNLKRYFVIIVQLLSCVWLCDPMDCSTPGLPVPHHLLKFTQVYVHCTGDTIQQAHPLTPSSPCALNLSQHQGLFQWFCYLHQVIKILELQLGLLWWLSKEFTCNVADLGSICGLGRSPGEGNGYPLQYSGLENSMDRGAWQATVHGVAKSWTWLSD